MILRYVDVVLILVTLRDGLLVRSRVWSFRMKYRQHKSHFVVLKDPSIVIAGWVGLKSRLLNDGQGSFRR